VEILKKLNISASLGLALTAVLVVGCSGSSLQSSLEPAQTESVNPITQATLQFEAGTAEIVGQPGLNALVTYRQNAGPHIGASILVNAPTITAPSGFVVPSTPDAGTDAGTNHISGYIPNSVPNEVNGTAPVDTFNPSGAAFDYLASSYGFFPALNTSPNGGTNLTPGPMPFYVANNPVLSGNAAPIPSQLQYIGGPPAFVPPGHTSTQDGSYNQYQETGQNVAGFTLGVSTFQATPVAGLYNLSVQVPTGTNQQTGVTTYGKKTASSTVAVRYLPAWFTSPTFVPDGTGGGTITTNFPATGGAAAITEEYLEFVNIGPSLCQLSGVGPYYYTFKVTAGTATVTVPDNIGAAPPGKAQPHTLCTSAENTAAAGGTATPGDSWLVYGFAVDYPLQSSAFPASQGQASPTIVGSAGQDDITTSNATTGTGP
jgi:hypothetical protein